MMTVTRLAALALALSAFVVATSADAGVIRPGSGPSRKIPFHPVHGPGSSHNPIVFRPVHGPGSSHNPIIVHPVHGPGSSHNPIIVHPVHGPGSSHNPIICWPGARPGSVDCHPMSGRRPQG